MDWMIVCVGLMTCSEDIALLCLATLCVDALILCQCDDVVVLMC